MTAAAPLKAVVVGTNIGCTRHVAGLRAGGFEVVGLVGRDPERTAERARALGIPHHHGALEAALDGDVDAVVVATPPARHHAMTMRAIAAGKHVLCEKPFALDPGPAREMRDAAREAGVVGHVVHQLRWSPVPTRVRALAADGSLGRLLHGRFDFDHVATVRGPDAMPGWWRHADQGGGWLHNYASHGIDLVRFMLGEFGAVAAALDGAPASGMTADDRYAVTFTLAGGMQGTMGGTCRARQALDLSRVVGDRATITFDDKRAVLADDDGTRMIVPTHVASEEPVSSLVSATMNSPEPIVHDPGHGLAEQAAMSRAFADRIRDPSLSHPAIATFDDGVAHMAVIAAIREAARSRRWVDIGEQR